MYDVFEFLPQQINTGPFLTAYTLDALRQRINDQKLVLPVCSLGTPAEELAGLAPLVLPPLFHEALQQPLRQALIQRIQSCFPFYQGSRRRAEFRGSLEVVDLPRRQPAAVSRPRVLAISVDTAVEEHGPHLPLATDTIQSYAVLRRLASEFDGMTIGPPLDYGQLTWGLPFGLSIDITAPLLTRYVTGYVNALLDWMSPLAVYVVDVHGSIVHRTAIVEGLAASRCPRWAFRWLHEPLVEFSGQRGDQHAGGVETALVNFINPELVDPQWWPGRLDELARGQMTVASAVEMSPDLARFVHHVEASSLNGIVGDIRNFFAVEPAALMERMLGVARQDMMRLIEVCAGSKDSA